MSIPTLYPFQMDLYNRVRAARGRGSRIIVAQAATGAGKTTWAGYVTQQAVARDSRVLFLVHRRRLVDQISGRLADFRIDHGVFMRDSCKNPSAPVQVASRDTILSRCFSNTWNGLPPAEVVIVDEAHHAAKPDSEYRRILEQYPRATILLLTATPVGPDGKGLGPWAQAIECALPTSQLVKLGNLCPVKCIAPDRKLVRGKVRKTGLAGDLVESWKEYAEGRATVLFCSRVQHSLDAVLAFQNAGIPASHVDADTPDDARDRAFSQLEDGTIKVLGNVGIIGEGVDVPALGCCQLFCECGGRVRFLQACGRIMRPFPGKEYGILIDHSGACFKHGFPDEDSEWTLEGNADEDFKGKHDKGETETALYCKWCERVFHGGPSCPGCGQQPSRPPRSVFAPPPVDVSGEPLLEVERGGQAGVYAKEEKVKHWLRCLAMAFHKRGTFGMAAQVYKRKYGEFPEEGYPCMPARWQWKERVATVYPNFGRKGNAS